MNGNPRFFTGTHQMDTKLVRRLLNKGDLLYDDNTRTISIDMMYIEHTDIDNSTVHKLKSDYKLPSALKERIVTTKLKNNNFQKYMRLSNNEIAKLWLCRDFIFGKDHFIAQKSSNETTDMEWATTTTIDRYINANHDIINVTNKDNDTILEKRSV